MGNFEVSLDLCFQQTSKGHFFYEIQGENYKEKNKQAREPSVKVLINVHFKLKQREWTAEWTLWQTGMLEQKSTLTSQNWDKEIKIMEEYS